MAGMQIAARALVDKSNPSKSLVNGRGNRVRLYCEREGEQIYLYNIYRSSNYISQQTGKYFRKSIWREKQMA